MRQGTLPATSDIALVAQSVSVEHTGVQGKEESLMKNTPKTVQTEVDELTYSREKKCLHGETYNMNQEHIKS